MNSFLNFLVGIFISRSVANIWGREYEKKTKLIRKDRWFCPECNGWQSKGFHFHKDGCSLS